MQQNTYSLKKTARISGLLYFLLVITGAYNVVYVPSQIMIPNDPVATSNNMLGKEMLFRSGIICDVISNIIFIFLVLFLYRLFKNVDENKSRLLVVLVIVQVPALFITEGLNIASLAVLKGEVLQTFSLAQRQELSMLFQRINEFGGYVLEMFWGIWLIPLGQLVYKSGFIPRVIGIFLIAGGVAYMVDSLLSLGMPDYRPNLRQNVETIILALVALGELSMMLWLMIKGVRNNQNRHAAAG